MQRDAREPCGVDVALARIQWLARWVGRLNALTRVSVNIYVIVRHTRTRIDLTTATLNLAVVLRLARCMAPVVAQYAHIIPPQRRLNLAVV